MKRENRTAFVFYAIALYDELDIEHNSNVDEYIYDYFSHVREHQFKLFEVHYLKPEYGTPQYLDKFIYFSESKNCSIAGNGYLNSHKVYRRAAYLAMLDALLVRYYYRDNNAPIDESDKELFNVLLEKLGFGEHDPNYAEIHGLVDYRHYADTFCLKQTRKAFAEELNQHYRNL